jgi:hypothetical protein
LDIEAEHLAAFRNLRRYPGYRPWPALSPVIGGGYWWPMVALTRTFCGLPADYKMVAAYGRGDEPVFAQGASVRSAVPVATS